MIDVTCYDAYGYPIDFLTQWDSNRVAVLNGIDLSPIPRVRFRNKHSKFSVVVRPTIEGTSVRAEIPNSLLAEPYPVILEVFYEYADGSLATRLFITIPVIPTKRPEDYVLIDNVDYKDWVAVKEEAEALMNELDLERDGNSLIVSSEEPEAADILWFNTQLFSPAD